MWSRHTTKNWWAWGFFLSVKKYKIKLP